MAETKEAGVRCVGALPDCFGSFSQGCDSCIPDRCSDMEQCRHQYAVEIMRSLRDLGYSPEQVEQSMNELEREEPRPSQPDPIECRTCRRDSDNATECDDCGPENSFTERSPMEPRP